MNEISFPRDGADPALLPVRSPAVETVAPATASATPILTRYYRIALRWKWLILGSIAAALLVGLLVTLLSTALFTATARIEINREGARIVNVEDVQPAVGANDIEFYTTQYGLLRSRSLAERVARDLRLADNAQFFQAFGRDELAQSVTEPGSAVSMRGERFRTAADILLANVEVEPVRGSRLVDISWTSPDRALSARVANAWVESYVSFNLERRFQATAHARRFLEQRLNQLRGRLEQSERQLVGYASQQAIINIPVAGADGAATSQERSLVADQLAALNAELARATADRVAAESRLRTAGSGATAETFVNPAIASLRQRRAEAAAEYSRLMTQFEPEYPQAQAVAAQIRQLDQAIATETSRVANTIRNNYRNSVEREQTISERVEGLKQSFLDQRRRSIQYNIFQREADTNRELYEGLLQRYKEIGVAGGVGANNISVVDRAEIPGTPSHPRPFLNLLIALLAGIAIGAGLALVREQLDETISDPEDLERRVGLPLLGSILRSEGHDPIEELKNPKSPIAEAYLSVQTSLAFSTDHGIPRSLAVTSTRPAEGKSTSAFAMAYLAARNGSRTLLIDGDMRSPSVHHGLGLNNQRGLSNYLAGTDNIDSLVQKPGGEPFYVLTSGPQPPNAAELLRSDRLDALFAELRQKFDYVIVDAPPIMGLADAPIIASRTEGTMFIIEAGGVKARLATVALSRLRQAKAHLLGAVLTKFQAHRAQYGYGYDYGYGYGSADSGKKSRAQTA